MNRCAECGSVEWNCGCHVHVLRPPHARRRRCVVCQRREARRVFT